MIRFLSILLLSVVSLVAQGNRTVMVSTNTGVLNAGTFATGVFPNITQFATDEQDISSQDPRLGRFLISLTQPVSGFWVWDNASTDPSGDGVIEAAGYVTGRWVRQFGGTTAPDLDSSKGVVIDASKRIVASTATKQQIDKATMQVATVADMVALSTNINDRQIISVAGYFSETYGGGGDFVYLASSTIATNRGTVFKPLNYAGRFIRVWSGDPINVIWFGADPTGSTDSTLQIQDAISFAAMPSYGPSDAANNSTAEVFIPAGRYEVSTLIITNIAGIYGVSPQQSDPNSGTVIYQKAGYTGPLISVSPSSGSIAYRKPHIHDLFLLGRKEQNASGKVSIASVSSRTSFAVATNNLPQYNAAGLSYPFYGHCFFYDSSGNYLGTAWIQSINYTTGDVTIRPGTDLYATVGGTVLTTSEKVIFSTAQTVNGWTGYSGSLATAGNSGIQLDGTGMLKLSRLRIEDFNVGILVLSGSIVPAIDVNIRGSQFAHVACPRPGGISDSIFISSFWQGYYHRDYALPPAPTTFTNNLYRRTLFGNHHPGFSERYSQVVVDSALIGIHQSISYGITYDDLLIDNVAVGAYWIDGDSAISKTAFRCPTLEIRNLFITTAQEQANVPSNGSETFGVKSSVAANMSVGVIGVTKVHSKINNNASNPDVPLLSSIFNLSASSVFQISQIEQGSIASATNIKSAGTVSPRFGSVRSELASATDVDSNWFFPTANALAYAFSGSEVFRISSTGIIVTNVSGAGVTVETSSGNGALKISRAASLQSVSLGATFGGLSVFNDITSSRILSVVENGNLVTIFSGRDVGTSGANVMAISAEPATGTDTAGADTRVLGGTGTGAGTPGIIGFFVGSSLASGTTQQTVSAQAYVDSTTSPTTLPLRINYNGTIKRIEVGAADSGGAGYRLLRISN